MIGLINFVIWGIGVYTIYSWASDPKQKINFKKIYDDLSKKFKRSELNTHYRNLKKKYIIHDDK